jgi:hypothetical protein
MRTRPAQDYLGHTVFCDDIRDELGGKVSYIGVYQTRKMFVHGEFPVTLPKFGFAISYAQKKELFVQPTALRIYLPGDEEEKPSIETEFPLIEGFLKDQAPSGENPFVAALARFVVSPLVINRPGTMKVRAVQGDEMVRLGALQVLPAPQVDSEAQAPTS